MTTTTGGPVDFDEDLRERIVDHLDAHARQDVTDTSLRHAAVVMLLAEDAGQATFLLTRRASRLSAHRGQWALPGGRVDAGETDVQAALRELEEELGLSADGVEVLGLLDDYPTRSGYRITPVVAWQAGDVTPRPNPAEVAELHHVPLVDLDHPDVPRWARYDGVDAPIIQIPIVGTRVHAPTGAVLYQFRELALHGRPTRVADLEEPPFAWS